MSVQRASKIVMQYFLIFCFLCVLYTAALSAVFDELRTNFEFENLEIQRDIGFYSGFIVILTIFQVALGIAGAILVLQTIKLSRKATNAAVEAVEVSRKIGNLQLRAYLLLANSRSIIREDGYGLILLFFKNSGQTPAVDAVIYCNGEWQDTDKPIDLPPFHYDSPASRYSVAPGETRQKMIGHDLKIPPHEIPYLRNGEKQFVVYGEIQYYDIFGQPHCGKFKGYVGGGAGFWHEGALTLSQNGNEEDWDFQRPDFPKSNVQPNKER